MTAETFFQLFNQYGLILVCAVVFCEYMNLPGFPAGVIMPCVGVLIARSELSLPLTVFLSVVAGVLGSLVIYAVYPHHCFHPGRTAPDAGQVVRRLVCGGHHGVEYRAHFVRVFLQREDSQHGNVTKYIDRVNPRICPVFAFFGRKWVHPFCKLHLQSRYGKIYTVI